MINEQRKGDPAFPPIPEDLSYLLDMSLRYRDYQFDDAVQAFIEAADESSFAELAATAERARLAGDYARANDWIDAVSDAIDVILDRDFPYDIAIKKEKRQEFEGLLGPELRPERREKAIRMIAEAGDRSVVAARRREKRRQLGSQANDAVHDMDVYFLFALLDACDFSFE